MGLAHTRAGPGGAIARSGGKVVVLCHPLLVFPASAVLLDLSISLLGYEALVCWICVSAALAAHCVMPKRADAEARRLTALEAWWHEDPV